MHRLDPDGAVPHPLKPALRLGAAGRGALPPLPVLAEVGPEARSSAESGAGGGTRRAGVEHLLAEDGPRGAEEVGCRGHGGKVRLLGRGGTVISNQLKELRDHSGTVETGGIDVGY
jgi:hypothetical protein